MAKTSSITADSSISCCNTCRFPIFVNTAADESRRRQPTLGSSESPAEAEHPRRRARLRGLRGSRSLFVSAVILFFFASLSVSVTPDCGPPDVRSTIDASKDHSREDVSTSQRCRRRRAPAVASAAMACPTEGCLCVPKQVRKKERFRNLYTSM